MGYRGKEAIPVSQMSTGQRTALVLSVFFQMNLTADYTPAFLLLDEPVANIDDLNILALIDFLREFVIIHHRQIIVTTANQNVAKLFRRKFSAKFLAQTFEVSLSSIYYYKGQEQRKIQRQQQDEAMRSRIQEIFEENNGRIGAERIRILLHNHGVIVSKKKIIRFMKQLELSSNTYSDTYYPSQSQEEERDNVQILQ